MSYDCASLPTGVRHRSQKCQTSVVRQSLGRISFCLIILIFLFTHGNTFRKYKFLLRKSVIEIGNLLDYLQVTIYTSKYLGKCKRLYSSA